MVDAIVPPPQITCSQWARRYRVLSKKWSRYPGPWQSWRTPFLDGPMNAFSSPSVRRITICKPAQMGGTEALLNMLGWAITCDPGPAMWVQAIGKGDSHRILNRIKSLTSDTPKVKEHKDEGQRYSQTLISCQFRDMTLWFGSSHSPTSLAQLPCKYVFCDEEDKYERWSGEESDPISLAMQRTESFKGVEKFVDNSTPTLEDGYIWQNLKNSRRLAFFVPCPFCGIFQPLIWGGPDVEHGVKWPGGREADPEELLSQDLVHYVCCDCGERWNDIQRREAVKGGMWCKHSEEPSKNPEPDPMKAAHLGFQWSRLYSTASHRLASFVVAWLEAQGYPEKLMAWVNNVLAEPYREVVKVARWDHLLNRCGGYELGQVPSEVHLLTAGVDVQDRGFFWVIRGWGHRETSWLIGYGMMPFPARMRDWEGLYSLLLASPMTTDDDRRLGITWCFIDSGYVPSEVYDFAKANFGNVRATKGNEQMMQNWKQGKEPDAGGTLLITKPSYFKEYMASRLMIPPGQPGCWYFPKGAEDQYFKQLLSHRKEMIRNRRTGEAVYKWRKAQGAEDHFLDCELQNCLAGKILNVAGLPPTPVQRKKPKTKRAKDRRAEDWLGVGSWEL